MKSLVRWSATAGLVGSALMGSLLAGTLQALAIPQEQIIQKLRPVPVFTIANAQGAPLVASPPTGQKGAAVAGVFINQKDAQDFLNNLKTKNPELAKNVKVVPVSLAEVYQLNQTNKGKPEQLDFAYVPSKQQVDTAVSLLKQQGGKQPQQFNGTPLFVARGGKEKGYLTIQQDGKSIIPMFFNKEELQGLLDRFKQQQPNMASSIEIQVLNLEGLMEVLRTKDDPQLNQIVLVPPQQSIEFIKSIAPPPKGTSAPGKPAVAPAPKK
jgi:nickel transport protein